VAPLRLGGRRGKQSTPRVWLGGTGERSTVGKRERQGARDCGTERWTSSDAGVRQRYDLIGEVGCTFIFWQIKVIDAVNPFHLLCEIKIMKRDILI
jgi:hypothetical protein